MCVDIAQNQDGLKENKKKNYLFFLEFCDKQ